METIAPTFGTWPQQQQQQQQQPQQHGDGNLSIMANLAADEVLFFHLLFILFKICFYLISSKK